MIRFLAIIAFTFIASVQSLRLQDAEEGTCNHINFQPLPNGDFNFVDRFRYLPAGSRYNMYSMALGHPRFREMRDFEMYYNMCLTVNGSTSVGHGAAIGFGSVLHNYSFRPRENEPSVVDTVPIVPNGGRRHQSFQREGGLTETITLTDHKTFAFLVNCWYGSNQASWVVFSLTPELSPATKQKIEQHAISLGFSREEIVFLNYNNCGGDIDGDNLDDEDHHWSFGGSSGIENRPVRNLGNVSNSQRTTVIKQVVNRKTPISACSASSGWSR